MISEPLHWHWAFQTKVQTMNLQVGLKNGSRYHQISRRISAGHKYRKPAWVTSTEIISHGYGYRP